MVDWPRKYWPPIGGPMCNINPGGLAQAWILVILPPKGFLNKPNKIFGLTIAAAAKEGASKETIRAGAKAKRRFLTKIYFSMFFQSFSESSSGRFVWYLSGNAIFLPIEARSILRFCWKATRATERIFSDLDVGRLSVIFMMAES